MLGVTGGVFLSGEMSMFFTADSLVGVLVGVFGGVAVVSLGDGFAGLLSSMAAMSSSAGGIAGIA